MSTNKPAEFNFYLNTQGPRGRQGAQGPQGVSPTITIGQNNANSFTLVITDANGTFETPNLKGNLVDVSDNGSYVRYQPSDGTLYTSDLDQATTSTVGGVRFATEENLLDDISSGVAISPSDLQDYLAAKLTAGDNISITKDDETGIVTISTTGGGSGGVSSYNDLTDKPELFGTVIQNDNTLSHYVPLKAPLKEAVGVDYEQDIVIENGTLADGLLTFANDWHPQFVDSYSSFTLQGKFTLNGNEFTPDAYASMPINKGDIIGFPGGTGADIACGHIRESDGQFIFTHLLRVDGLTGAGEQSTENWCNLHITNKTASGSTLQCSAENGTSTWLSGKNITNGACYFQFRQDTDGSYIVVFIRQNNDGNTYGIKTVFNSSSAKTDLAQLSRVFYGGTDVLQNPQNQFFIYRNPGINLEDINSESDFDSLTNMVNWQFPDAEHSLYVDYDNNTIKVNEDGQLYANINATGFQEKFTPVEPLRFQESISSVYEGYTLIDSTFSWTSAEEAIAVRNSYLYEDTYSLNSYDVNAGIINEKYFFDMPISKDYFYYGYNNLIFLGVKNEITKDFEPIFAIRGSAVYRVTKMLLSGNVVRMYLAVVIGTQASTGPNQTSHSLRFLTTDGAITGLAWGTPNNYYESTTFTGERLADLQRCNVARFRPVATEPKSSEYTLPSNSKNKVWAVFSMKGFDGVIPSMDEVSQYGQLIPIPSPESTLNLTFNEEVIPTPYTLPAATTTSLGGVKPDGTTITVTGDGTISSVGGGTGGTTDYTALTNKPQINSVELTGNKSLTDVGAQAITDNTLTTTAKTIVGAINELVTRIAALETQVTNLNTVIDGQTGGSTDA